MYTWFAGVGERPRMRDNVMVEPHIVLIWTQRGYVASRYRKDVKDKEQTVKWWRISSFFLVPHPVHMLGAGIGSKHGEDPRPAADVQDDFIFEHVLVVVHGIPVGQRPHLVLQHLLWKMEKTHTKVWSRGTSRYTLCWCTLYSEVDMGVFGPEASVTAAALLEIDRNAAQSLWGPPDIHLLSPFFSTPLIGTLSLSASRQKSWPTC